MSVSGELLCSFELLKPLDSAALKNHIKKGRNKRNSMLGSPVSLGLCVDLLHRAEDSRGAVPTVSRFITRCLRLYRFRC